MASLNHGDMAELLSAYIDGELLEGELTLVSEHLSGCEECILEFRQLKEVRAAVVTLPMLHLPERVAAETLHLGPQLSAYLDGELETTEIPAVIQHLSRCRDCLVELQELDAARTAVRSLPRVEVPSLLVLGRERPRPSQRRWRLASVAAGIAAAVVIALGVTSTTSQPSSIDLESFANRHVARASVEQSFAIVPAVSPVGVGP